MSLQEMHGRIFHNVGSTGPCELISHCNTCSVRINTEGEVGHLKTVVRTTNPYQDTVYCRSVCGICVTLRV